MRRSTTTTIVKDSLEEKWREQALRERAQIQQDWDSRNRIPEPDNTPTFQDNATHIDDYIIQFDSQREATENLIPEIDQRLQDLESARGWTDFWLSNFHWWHNGSWLQNIAIGSSITFVLVGGGFLLYRYFRRSNENFGVKTTQKFLDWLKNRK